MQLHHTLPETAPAAEHTVSVRGPLIAYVLASVVLFPFYRYLIGSDGISYLSIANHYLAGKTAEAVNLYWGPLYSWLLAIPLAAHASGTLALRIVCFAAGLLALFAYSRLARRFELSPKMETISLWIAAAMIFAFTLRDQPDLLLTALLLPYFAWILDSRYPDSRWSGVLCGVFGGLAFLTKSYAFVFFLGHFTLLNLLHWWRVDPLRRTRVIRNFALGYAAFAILAVPWIAILSQKNGALTIGTTGEFNYRLAGPQSHGYPMYQRLLEPPNPDAISFWEQPSPDTLLAWTPLSRSGILHQVRLAWSNFKELLFTWQEASILSIAFLFAYCLWGMSSREQRVPWYFVVLTILVFPAGYLLITLQDRYLWPEILLFVLIGAVVSDALISTSWLSETARKTLIAAFVISFLLLPLRLIAGARNGGRAMYDLSSQIRQKYSLEGAVASCGNWNDSLYLAYYLHLHFLGDTGLTPEEAASAPSLNPSLGTTPAAMSSEDAANQLSNFGADYFLAWQDCTSIPATVSQKPDITGGSLRALKIYRLR